MSKISKAIRSIPGVKNKAVVIGIQVALTPLQIAYGAASLAVGATLLAGNTLITAVKALDAGFATSIYLIDATVREEKTESLLPSQQP